MWPTAKNTLDAPDQGGYKESVQSVTLRGFNPCQWVPPLSSLREYLFKIMRVCLFKANNPCPRPLWAMNNYIPIKVPLSMHLTDLHTSVDKGFLNTWVRCVWQGAFVPRVKDLFHNSRGGKSGGSGNPPCRTGSFEMAAFIT